MAKESSSVDAPVSLYSIYTRRAPAASPTTPTAALKITPGANLRPVAALSVDAAEVAVPVPEVRLSSPLDNTELIELAPLATAEVRELIPLDNEVTVSHKSIRIMKKFGK